MTVLAADIPGKPARTQARWLFVFLAIVVGTCLAIDLVARNRTLERWLMAKSSEYSEKNGKLFSNTGNFIDYEERIFLDEIPNRDFSKGGIYFFGTSNMKWAFTTWDLPDDLKQQLGNYGIGASTHQTMLRLIRYLGEKGLFASGDKSEVILGVSYHLGSIELPSSYFPALVRRQDLYVITPDDRLAEAPMNAIERWWRTEKTRSAGFLWDVGRVVNNWVQTMLGRSRQPPHNPEAYRRSWREFMGQNWQQNIDREVGRLRETIELLKANKVPVKIVLLPQGTWMNDLPFGAYYDSRVRALSQATSTPLFDWSRAFPDSDFIDSNHLTVAGQTKFRDMLLKEEAERLQRKN